MHSNVFFRELRGGDQRGPLQVSRRADTHSLVGSFGRHRRGGSSVGRRSSGGRDGVEWVGGRGGALSRWQLSPSRSVTSRIRGITPNKFAQTSGTTPLCLLAVTPDNLRGAKAQWRMTIGDSKKEKGPGVGSAQRRSRSLARRHRSHSQRRAFNFHAAVQGLVCMLAPGGCSSMNGCPSDFGTIPESPVGQRSKREKLRRKL